MRELLLQAPKTAWRDVILDFVSHCEMARRASARDVAFSDNTTSPGRRIY